MVILRRLAAIVLVAVAIAPLFDVSLSENEERSRGTCSIGSTDTSYALCTGSD